MAKYFVAEIPKAPKEVKEVKEAKKPKAPKVNIKPVKIDFPLPENITGIENRLNTKNTFKLPEVYFQKH